MAKFDDYINSLEGQPELDVAKVVADLHKIHNDEIGTRDAKINELDESNSSLTKVIEDKDSEITGWKAKNYDLSLQIPGVDPKEIDKPEDGKPDSSTITTDDLFTK